MAALGVGGIEPHSSAPPPARPPSRSTLPSPFSSIQEQEGEGEESEEGDYYDIMIVGITGQGKSTTADKMIIASSPAEASPPEEQRSDVKKITEDGLTFWSMGEIPDDKEISIIGYLKKLTLCRCLKDPHLNINEYYEQEEEDQLTEEGEETTPTSTCRLTSNDVTRIRVLDVPGFFTSTSDGNSDSSPSIHSSRALERSVNRSFQRHLMVMRNILRIQSTMKMRFRRILYFLPIRGPLQKRRSEVLMQELHLLALYFGKCVFECMILVATLPTFQKDGHFPERELQKTQILFRKALKDVLLPHCNEGAIPTPPVIFISMADKCEQIVEKVESAEVPKDSLELTIHPGICVKCSSLIKWLGDERVECIPVGRSEDAAIPFGDSFCHPIFIPRGGTLQTIELKGRIPYVVISKEKGRGLNDSEEICLKCGEVPGTVGCMKVGDTYTVNVKDGKSEDIKVDHTNRVEKHRRLSQSDESKDNPQQPPPIGAPPTVPQPPIDAPPTVPRAGGRAIPRPNPDELKHRIIEIPDEGAHQDGSQNGGGGGVDIPGSEGRRRPRKRHQGSDAVSEESGSGPDCRQVKKLEGSSIVAEASDGYLSAKLVSGKNLSKEVGEGFWGKTLGQERERTDNQPSLLEEAGFADMKGV